jgi:ABC-type glycerol-3-phosphate transport system substrate-binding protein
MPEPSDNRASLTRRAAIGSLAAAGAAAILWPYTPRTRANIPRGRIELNYWEKWTGREGISLQQVVDRFNQSQDRLWVHLVPVGDITSKAMVAIGGGDPPDIVGLYTYNIPGYAEARAVIPLEDFAHLGAIDPTRYAPAIRALLTHEGRQWAGVNTCYSLGLYYNRAMLREAGHDPDHPPRTISELDALAEQLTHKDPQGRITQAGFLQNLPDWWPYFWPFMFGGRLYDESTDRATLAEPQCIQTFEWLRACAARYGVAATRAFASGFGRSIHSAQDPFISGKVAMIVQGPWLANFIRAFNPNLDYACAPVPVADPLYNADHPSGMLEADVLMIPRGCPHPEEAYQFLSWMQRQDVQEQLATAHCKPSPFVQMSPGFLENHPNRSIRVHDAIAKSPKVQILPRTRAWKQYGDLIVSAFESIWSGADPTTELTSAQARAQQLIDRVAALRKKRGITSVSGGGT